MFLKSKIKSLLLFLLQNLAVRKVTVNISVLPKNSLLVGRKALITGGTSGIGFEIAKSYVTSGCKVVITGRNKDRLNKACERISIETGTTNSVSGMVMDVTDINNLLIKYNEASDCIGDTFDILVNNAGVMGGDLYSATENEFDSIIDTNLKGLFFLSKIFAESLRKQNKEGNILNISSSSSYRPATSVYGISKWGVRGFTEGMARKYSPYGIIVNAIAPGPTATPMLKKDNTANFVKNNSLIKRYILPEEIANMAVIMVSDMAKSIVGDTVCMTGGSGNLTNDDIVY